MLLLRIFFTLGLLLIADIILAAFLAGSDGYFICGEIAGGLVIVMGVLTFVAAIRWIWSDW